MNKYIEVLKPSGWYKNILIFIPLFLGLQLLNINLYFNLIIGFICLCLMSSWSYIINDIVDINADRLHTEKKNRPIASGKISISFAQSYALAIWFLTLGISINLNITFMMILRIF